jgi:hypothetical protein
MDQYQRQLDRIQISICAILFVLLFGGILVLPRIGQYIWIAIIIAIHVRVTLVISRREEQLEKLNPANETTERSAWYYAAERHVAIPDVDGTKVLSADPKWIASPETRCSTEK